MSWSSKLNAKLLNSLLKYSLVDSSGLSILIGISKHNPPSLTKKASSIISFSFNRISFFLQTKGEKLYKTSDTKFVFEIPLKKINFSISSLYIENIKLFLSEYGRLLINKFLS